MKNYDVTLTAYYEKTVSVCADSPEQAAEKVKIILFDTDLIEFSDDDFVCGDEEYGLNEEAHEMASGRKEIDTQTETKDAPEVDADKEVK